MSLESWAIDKLSVFMGFDPETLQTQILPYLMTSETPEAFAEQLMDMVGTSDEALSFIHEFSERRFHSKIALSTSPPPQPKSKAQTKPNVKSSTSSNTGSSSIASKPQTNSESVFPSLPSNKGSYEDLWPVNINVHKKDDDYFSGLRKSKRSKNKSQAATTELRATAFPAENKPQTPKKEKKKPNKEMTLEAALKELDIKAEKPGSKRKPCQCQATKHPLLTVAPNCLSCGKIICTAEGVGPCTFCQAPVLSKEQQLTLIAEAKRKRSEQKQVQNQPKKAQSASKSGGKAAYASKLGGSHNSFSPYESSDDETNRINAEKHKDKLLEFQRTSAKRSTVIDQAADFELPTDQLNPWLSPQERALLIKKQQSNLKRVEKTGGSGRHKVMTLDLTTKQVKVQDATSPSSSDNEDETLEIKSNPVNREPTDGSSAGTYSHNPLLKGITAPKFVGKQSKKPKGQLRRKARLQYDVDDMMNDYQYSTSLVDDTIDPSNEPITCG